MSGQDKSQEIMLFTMMGEFIPGGFFIYNADAEEKVTYCNRRLQEIFGCKSMAEFVEVTGGTFKGMVHPDDYQRVTKAINRQITESEEKRDSVEYRILHKDGTERRVTDYGMWFSDLGGSPAFTVFIEDITDKIW